MNPAERKALSNARAARAAALPFAIALLLSPAPRADDAGVDGGRDGGADGGPTFVISGSTEGCSCGAAIGGRGTSGRAGARLLAALFPG